MDAETREALLWLAKHELWTDVYPDGPDQSQATQLPPEHVRAARKALGLTAADLGYYPSTYAAKLSELDCPECWKQIESGEIAEDRGEIGMDNETEAMSILLATLVPFPPVARRRIISWLDARLTSEPSAAGYLSLRNCTKEADVIRLETDHAEYKQWLLTTDGSDVVLSQEIGGGSFEFKLSKQAFDELVTQYLAPQAYSDPSSDAGNDA